MKHKAWTYGQKAWTIAAVFALLGAFLWCQNNWLSVTRLTVEAGVSDKLRIVHLSDLHGAWFGSGQGRIASSVEEMEPDVIVITGDFIDRRCDERAAAELLDAMTDIAPTYCVTGNHEELERQAGTGTYERLLEAMEKTGARLLRGETVPLTADIALTGADDIPFAGGLSAYPDYLMELGGGVEKFSILLMHRPEMFEYAAAAGFDLTLSGHAHGGQIRLPFIGGLYAPGQGVLPEYTAGLYTKESGAQMAVSRGLGNSVFPLRIFNRPEITVIDIEPTASP